jgi:hypothetical protein
LSDLWHYTKKDPFEHPSIIVANEKEFARYASDDVEAFHEAGFDAYMTGVVFLKMGHYLHHALNIDFTMESLILKPFRGKINIVASDIPYLDLEREQTSPERSHVFRVQGFPTEWTTQTLIQTFDQPLRVRWLEPSHCLIILHNEPTDEFFETWGLKGGSKELPFTIEPLDVVQAKEDVIADTEDIIQEKDNDSDTKERKKKSEKKKKSTKKRTLPTNDSPKKKKKKSQ